MPVVTCLECGKKLNVPATAAGKKVRCPGCQAVFAVPAGEDTAPSALPPAPAAPKVAVKPAPKPKPAPEPEPEPEEEDEPTPPPKWKKKAKPESENESVPPPKWKKKKPEPEDDDEEGEEDEADLAPGLRCAKCKAASVKALPPNEFSRRPGYVCTKCDTIMRRPGSKVSLFAVVGLGILIALMGVGLAIVAWGASKNRIQMFGGAGGLAVLGLSVSGWALTQSKLPVPIGAKAPPSRMGLLVAIILIGLLLAGGLVFGIMYAMQEGL